MLVFDRWSVIFGVFASLCSFLFTVVLRPVFLKHTLILFEIRLLKSELN